jgi:hypothetical protein
MLHNYIIFSIILENCIPFCPAVTEELRGSGVKTIVFPAGKLGGEAQ